MDLFENVKPESFLLFFRHFNVTLAAWGTLATDAKFQYLCNLVFGEALRQFDAFSADMEGTYPLTLETIILGLDLYLFSGD